MAMISLKAGIRCSISTNRYGVGGQQHGVAQAHFIREIKVLIQGEVQIRIYDAHRFLRLGGRGFDQRGHKSTLGSFVCCNTAKTTVWGAPVPEIKKSRSTNSRTSTAVLSGIGGYLRSVDGAERGCWSAPTAASAAPFPGCSSPACKSSCQTT